MKVLFNAAEIAQKVNELGQEITAEYEGCNLYVIGILKGGFIFMADLVRAIRMPVRVGFVRLSSYGNSDRPQGNVKILDDVEDAIQGRHVLIVDDIMDTGQSLLAFKKHLESKGPVSVKICTMINKKQRRNVPMEPDYYGFEVPEGFIVGYGLDYAEDYRALPEICVIESNNGGGNA